MPNPATHDAADAAAPGVRATGWRHGWWAWALSTAARASLGVLASLVLWSLAPSLVGWSSTAVLTGSMAPAVDAGDVVVISPAEPTDVVPGAIVLAADPDQPGEQLLHRVVSVGEDGQVRTKGDANPAADSSPLLLSDVHGVAELVLPGIALPVSWLRDDEPGLVAAAALAVLAATAAAGLWLPPARDRRGDGSVLAPRGLTTVDRTDDRGSSPRPRRGGRTTADRTRYAVPVALLLLAVAVSATDTGSTAWASFTARTDNPANTLGVNPYWTCSDAARAVPALQHYALDETSGTAAANDGSGTTGPGSYQGTYTLATPGPRCARTTTVDAVTFGTNGALTTGGGAQPAPSAATVQVWINTTAAGGRIAGFGDSQTGTSVYYDRGLYLRTDGRVSFGIVSGFANGGVVPSIVTSDRAVDDGAWHLVTGTFGDGSVRLYVDGTQVGVTTGSAVFGYTGWWRWGHDNLNGVPDAPADPSFIGSMAHAAVFDRPLTATEVMAQYGAGT